MILLKTTAMEKISKEIQNMEKQWFSINPNTEQEPYILTEEEEGEVLVNEIRRRLEHFVWKCADKGLSPMEIELRVAQSGIKNLSEEEKKNIFQTANSNKQYQIWQKEQREKEKLEDERRREELRKTWTAGKVLQLMRWSSRFEYGKELIENSDTMPLIKTICLFLSSDQRFETDLGYSLKKGLWIRGVSGLGKTHLIRCVAKNEINPIAICSMIEIADQVKSDGDYTPPTAKKLYLDDVGSETPTVKHYGTEINWFKEFLETFYLRSQQYNHLIVSTNCNFKDIEDMYGFRVRSRIKDMFNVIDVTGTDLRGL
jgi:DNA replication protein DnaC